MMTRVRGRWLPLRVVCGRGLGTPCPRPEIRSVGVADSAAVMGMGMAALATAVFALDVAAELPHATARAATVFVDVAGAPVVAAAVIRPVVAETVVGAMGGLQGRVLAGAGGDEVVRALQVAVAGSADSDGIGGRVRFLAPERNGPDRDQCGAESLERSTSRDVVGNSNCQAIEAVHIHDASPLPRLGRAPTASS